ncbi:phage terminase large subunit family protein [Burkholderia cepacia]|uniref:Phage terminase large subunit family protein n=3 Tax=Burkholderia cepacia TaxID=292 RepID=A0AAX2RSD5_BURCE|nr:phage terminase large subunit family protein [Burkholderia cepacia]MBA9945197.1 phage terminase large subunit family protein [Burkholderia cepacia]MBA9975787.1 phage terminase large subunit family protein [Burkholderia cepacia]MBA9993844.1 phage terminase large subunit family protein [Burkholderia cepacia]MBB0006492.1 phage terminase large subunit family protein [Burkholderia cepacia]
MDALSSFLNTTQTVHAVIRRIAMMLRPPEQIATTEWARKYRRLSAKGSASPGRYNPNITPWVFGMHDALDDPTVQKVVCMKSAQVAWTDGVLLNYIGKRIDVAPCPMVVMFPKEKTAKKFNLEKFEPMVEVTPRLAAKLPVHAARDKNNLWDHKTFAGGFLKFVTSNAPDDVKSTPAPVVAVEEPDDANTNVREQGDSITLLEERIKSYSGRQRKMILGGTPTVDGLSRIQQGYAASDQRVYLVPCPDCDEEHELAWENVTWSEGAEVVHEVYGRAQPETARYTCPHCGSLWDDATRIRAVRRGRWVATAPFHGVAGFRINELVSPFPGSNMAELVKKWLTANKALREGDDTKMRAFVNNSQGRPYKYRTDLPELDVLAERALPYAELTVPTGGLVLTLGVDVQHDRLAIVLRAWGRGEESWLVLWGEIYGNVTEQQQDPMTGGVWGALTMLLSHAYRHENGWLLRVRATSIDSSDGATSDAVYKYVRAAQHAGYNVMAVKGSSNVDAEIFSVPKASIDSTRNNSKAAKYGLRPYMVGVSRAKDLILENRLKLEGDGPGRMHWYSGVRSDYLSQLTAEVKVPGPRGGKRVWKKISPRNEALDCEGYALHAARSVKVHLMTEAHWQVEQHRASQVSLFDAVPVLEALPSALPAEVLPDPPIEEAVTETPRPSPQVAKPTETPPPSGVSRIQGRRVGRSTYLKRR